MDTNPPAARNHAFERLLETLKTPFPSRSPGSSPMDFRSGSIEPGSVSRERERRQAIERLYERIANQFANAE